MLVSVMAGLYWYRFQPATSTIAAVGCPVPRVALVLPYWDFWERSVPHDLRAEREALARRVVEALAADVVVVATVDSDASGEEAARRSAEARAEVVLVMQTMAAPPARTLAALGTLPVVVWAAQKDERVPDAFDHGGITSFGATVGAPMVTSMLVRHGRPFELVVGPVGRTEPVDAALRAAAAATRLARARVGRVGPTQPGYDHVTADSGRLRAEIGIELLPIESSEFRDFYAAVPAERVAELELETRELYDVEVEGDGLERSLRAACALDDLVERYELDAGAINCHVPEIRLGDEVGIAPCFALGRSTSNGVPWTCTGDVVTAIAMLTAKLLGGAAQYHELEALDESTGELVVASSGEHDLELAPGVRPRLVANGWYAQDPCTGVCACFTAPRGLATLVGFTQLDAGFRLIAAEGEFTGRGWPGVGTANAAFRFADGSATEAWARWCAAGVTHHAAASPGLLGAGVEACARFLGIDAVRV
jgi:L-arabinose isomerase